AMCMADYREVNHGFDILSRLYDPTLKDLFAVLDTSVPNAAKEALEHFNQQWPHIRNSTYIASLSEHDETRENIHGRLSMWRAFGATPIPRVALVLALPWYTDATLHLSLIFSPIGYFTESDVAAEMAQVTQNIRQNVSLLQSVDKRWVFASAFGMLLTAVTCMKHEGFHEEREWRVIHQPTWWPSKLVTHSTRTIGGVPQLVY